MYPHDRRSTGPLSISSLIYIGRNLRAMLSLNREGLIRHRESTRLRRATQMLAAKFDLSEHQDSLRGLAKHHNIAANIQSVYAMDYKQKHLLTVLDNIFAFVAILAPDGTVLDANRAALEQADITPDDVAGKKFWDCSWWDYSPDVQGELRNACEQAASDQPTRSRVNIRTPSGSLNTIDFMLAPVKDGDERITYLIASGVDITENKKTEDAYREICGRLICIQDEERRRIARELHDDLGQRMALIAIELEQLEQVVPKRSHHLHPRIQDILEKTLQISAEIHRLSHESHPTFLDHLGLVAALQSFCDELCRRHPSLTIEFRHHSVPTRLDADTGLCIFRIVQEALHNVIKHSGANSATIVLEKIRQRISLSISDQGCGFDTESVRIKDGLGLISMRERLALVGGSISITSQPLQGTQIKASVPLTRPANTSVPGRMAAKA